MCSRTINQPFGRVVGEVLSTSSNSAAYRLMEANDGALTSALRDPDDLFAFRQDDGYRAVFNIELKIS